MKKPLSKKEKKIYDWIKAFQLDKGEYPTYRDIQLAFHLSSINSITQYIKQLARKGYLELTKHKGYRLPKTERPAFVTLPFVGSIQAGNPNFTQESEDVMTVPEHFAPSARSFLLKVRGNSMEDAGIFPGDIVIVDAAKKEKEGDIVVALVDEETTLKRLVKEESTWVLKAESREHQDIHPGRTWKVQGVVTGLWRHMVQL